MILTQKDLLLLLVALNASVKRKPGDKGWTDLHDKMMQEYNERFRVKNATQKGGSND